MRQPTSDQILEWKQRRGPQSGPAYDVKSRLGHLERAWNTSADPHLLEFIPMRITTCVEVYAREVIRELVDAGGDYLEAAGALAKNSKIDLVFAAHLSGQKLSIGDFVAHTVSINSVESVVAALSALISKFPNKLKTSHPRWTEEINEWPVEPMINNYDAVIGTLARMFRVRHVLTHELPENQTVEKADIPMFLDAARRFVEACDWVVVAELQGSVPKTQVQMNLGAGEQLKKAMDELDDLLKLVLELNGNKKEVVEKIQVKWQEFVDLEASMIASQVEGGSMYPMLWAAAKEELVQDRILQLKRVIKGWMD